MYLNLNNLPMKILDVHLLLLVPDNMTYEQRSELRKECSRFLRFSYLIDFIGLESL